MGKSLSSPSFRTTLSYIGVGGGGIDGAGVAVGAGAGVGVAADVDEGTSERFM